ncbi:MAG: type II secretion system F family protein, partial [Nocardioidaceae bacterium]
MGVLLGLCCGVGLMLVWLSLSGAPRVPRRRPLGAGVVELLRRAGVRGVTPAALAGVCLGLGLLAGVLMLVVSRTVPVAVLFATLAAYLPVALLRGRARRRQRELADVWPEAVDNLASAVRAGLS